MNTRKMKKIEKEFIIKNTKWIILFICLIGFLSLAEDVFNKEIMNGDIIGYKIISTFLISDFATPIAKFITNFGGAIFLITLTVILWSMNPRISRSKASIGHSTFKMSFLPILLLLAFLIIATVQSSWSNFKS